MKVDKSIYNSPEIKWCINPNCGYSVGQEGNQMSICTKCGTVQEPKEIEDNCTTCIISNICGFYSEHKGDWNIEYRTCDKHQTI